MNVYFQFLTRDQSSIAIKLIELPPLLVSRQDIAGKIKMSAGGRLRHSKFKNLETLSEKLEETPFNELEVNYEIAGLAADEKLEQVKMLNGVFYPAVTGKLWFSSKDFNVLEDRRSRQRMMNAKTKEEALSYHGVSVMPCVFEVALEIETSRSLKQVLDFYSDRIVNALGSGLCKLGAFGCCDAGGVDFYVRLEAYVPMIAKNRVMAKAPPVSYPELGKKFDGLHPVMFGTKRVCSEIAAALGDDATLICRSDQVDFAVIRLSAKCDLVVARQWAKDWLLPTIR